MKKLFLLFMLIPFLSFGQVGIRESVTFDSAFTIANAENLILSGGQIYGNVNYDKPIAFTIFDPSTISPDTAWIGVFNFSGADWSLDSIKANCDVDDQDVSLVKRQWNTGSTRTLIDAFTITTDGTDNYYHTETTLSNSVLENGEQLGMLKTTTASNQISIYIFKHDTVQVVE